MSTKSKLLSGAGILKPIVPKPPPMIVNGKKAASLSYAHQMVVDTARGMAHELYETMMRKNESWEVWKHFCADISKDAGEEEFVRLALPYLLDDARATLAGMLGQPRYERLHAAIYDALLKDNLIRGTGGLVPVARNIKEAYQDGRP